jgi:prolipoprotein diacylglyceryltransferase
MAIPVHAVTDALAYSVAMAAFFAADRKLGTSRRPMAQSLLLVISAFFFGAVVAKAMPQFETGVPFSWSAFIHGFQSGSKTIMGGILGGIIGIKLAKRMLPRNPDTGKPAFFGDQAIVPIAVGVFIGRIGCFMSGLNDNTHGAPTSLGWGWDYGDGILRHPVQVYEMIGVAILTAVILISWKKFAGERTRFRVFLFGFCLIRFLIEFVGIHPSPYFGLTIYQVLCLAGMVWAPVL